MSRKQKNKSQNVDDVVHIKIAKSKANNLQMVPSHSPVVYNDMIIDQDVNDEEGTGTIGTCTDDDIILNTHDRVTFGNYLDDEYHDEYKIADDEFVVEDDDDDALGVSTPGTLNVGGRILANDPDDAGILIEGDEGRNGSIDSIDEEDDEIVDEINSEFKSITPGHKAVDEHDDDEVIDDIDVTPL